MNKSNLLWILPAEKKKNKYYHLSATEEARINLLIAKKQMKLTEELIAGFNELNDNLTKLKKIIKERKNK